MRVKKRLIILTDTLSIDGGASRIAYLTAKLMQKDFELIVITGDRSNLLDIKTKYYSLNLNDSSTKSLFSMLFSFSSFIRLRNILKEIEITSSDIVHNHSWVKILSPSIFILLFKCNVVITAHDYFLKCPNGGFFNYQKKQICKLKPLTFSCLSSNCDKKRYS